MAVETFSRSSARPVLDRSLDLSRVNWEVVAYLAIVFVSVIAHLWNLGAMAMHHDESIHAWSSWRFYTGSGTFNCANGGQSPTYCYDPVYHGPILYVLTLISYFLFGDGDAQARLPMALAGIGMVASCWWLRPYLGRWGALVAAVFLGFSPSLLYFTRFARHDGLMVLWEVWMVVGIFRWLDTGRSRWLILTTASIALAVATHELYYILFFVFGIFMLMRLLSESRFARWLNLALLVVIGLCVVFMVINPPLPVGQGLYLGEKAFLVASALVLAWLCQRVWDPQPLLIERFKQLWNENRSGLWIALAVMASIYVVLYTTFFAYPRGAIDGLYAGLAYWLGSQQEYARGDQPWYYYLIQLPLYEPLAVLAGFGTVGFLIKEVVARQLAFRRRRTAALTTDEISAPAVPVASEAGADDVGVAVVTTPPALPDDAPIVDTPTPQPVLRTPLPLFPLLLVFWFFMAVILFSWAGEKMPWLVVHMALPGNLLAAWVISRLIEMARVRHHNRVLDESGTPIAAEPTTPLVAPAPRRLALLVPLLVLLLLVSVSVALWRFGLPSEGQEAQRNLLQGIVPLLVAGGLLYGLLTVAQRLSVRAVLALAGVTVAALIGAYTLRSTWNAVYAHPDVPVELLVYTQTAPDVPRYVGDIRELAINLTRNNRTAEDETGGRSMPIIISGGNVDNSDGSLAWPLQWYLRDFQKITWIKTDKLQDNPSAQTFEVQLPGGETGLAPVVLLYKPNVNSDVREALSQNYVQPYGEAGVFNWWFPEGDKCSPEKPGYKRFYYNTWTAAEAFTEGDETKRGGCGSDISAEVSSPFAPILWSFQSQNWGTLWNFAMYRELPYPLVPGAREMEFWLRSDLAGGFGEAAASTNTTATLRLVAQQEVALPSNGGNPTGTVVDSKGNLYVANTNSHEVYKYDSSGTLVQTLGGRGSGPAQFYEPRGLAVDANDNLYVADTWNARISKFDPDGTWLAAWGTGDQDMGDGRRATITDGTQEGNAATPLGLFGPRGVAVGANGNVYIADTGNKRIVVTDGTGNYLYQWGYAGADPGAFNEPTGVATDRQGNVYVADTWNSRVQVFAPGASDQVDAVPIVTWRVSGWEPNTYNDPAIAASPDGTVYVSVPSQSRVLAANLRGDLLLRWGGKGTDSSSLAEPSGVAVAPDGSVVVVEREGSRVLRFDLPDVQAATE